ncbi:hypothetical protein PATSB16_11180 [Pandoraea thiooxydans]|nr:hypothetical protein PATSB16_11180 [Pandoraea thiooxydans]
MVHDGDNIANGLFIAMGRGISISAPETCLAWKIPHRRVKNSNALTNDHYDSNAYARDDPYRG